MSLLKNLRLRDLQPYFFLRAHHRADAAPLNSPFSQFLALLYDFVELASFGHGADRACALHHIFDLSVRIDGGASLSILFVATWVSIHARETLGMVEFGKAVLSLVKVLKHLLLLLVVQKV